MAQNVVVLKLDTDILKLQREGAAHRDNAGHYQAGMKGTLIVK